MTNKKENKDLKWWMTKTSYVLLFVGIMCFGYTKTEKIFTKLPLKVTIDKTKEGMSTVVGQAPNAVYITINGREIFIDKEGHFQEDIAILSGLQTVRIEARDKFGHVSQKEFEVFYKEKVEVALISNH